MNKNIKATQDVTIGLDLGDVWSEGFVLDREGNPAGRFRTRTRAKDLQEALSRFERAGVVLEVGTHSPWVSRRIEAAGHQAIVANPRRVRLIAHSDRKSDRSDAEQLARLGRADPALLSPIQHRGEAAQRDRALLAVRDGLVRARTGLINQVRGLAKSLGVPVTKGDASSLARRAARELPEELFRGQGMLLKTIEELTHKIRQLDREIETLARERYPETELLRQVVGVGAITSLAYVLTLEDPRRFARSRAVGAYLGLCPRQRDSGGSHPELRISRAGDRFLRRLLVQCAHYILGPFGPDTDLRRFGLRLIEQGGRRARKRARVAVARKLAVLLHQLWRTGEEYQPLRHGETGRKRKAA
jgi:transposase